MISRCLRRLTSHALFGFFVEFVLFSMQSLSHPNQEILDE